MAEKRTNETQPADADRTETGSLPPALPPAVRIRAAKLVTATMISAPQTLRRREKLSEFTFVMIKSAAGG